MKLCKILKKCSEAIIVLILACVLAACSSPSGGSSDSGSDSGSNAGKTNQNNEGNENNSDKQKESKEQKKNRLYEQMLGSYKADSETRVIDIDIKQDKLLIDGFLGVTEVNKEDFKLVEELPDDDLLFKEIKSCIYTYFTDDEYYWNGELIEPEKRYDITYYKADSVFGNLDKTSVYEYNVAATRKTELKKEPAVCTKMTNALVYKLFYDAYIILFPDRNEIICISYSESKERIGTYISITNYYYYWRTFLSNYGENGEWTYTGSADSFSEENQELIKEYENKVQKDTQERKKVKETDSYELNDYFLQEKNTCIKVKDNTTENNKENNNENNEGNNKENNGGDNIVPSGFEGYTWKYSHQNVSSTTTQNAVFKNGTITVTTITESNKSGTTNKNREETASYKLDDDKITITYSNAGYDMTADFTISVEGNTLTLEGEDDDYDAIALLGVLFQNDNGTSKMSFTLSDEGSASDSNDDEDDSNSTIKASDIENITWKYQYEYNNWYFEFKNGKVTQRHVIQGSSMGGLEGTYKLKGDKLTVTYQSRYDGSDITGTVRLSFTDYGLKLDAEGDTNAGYVVNGFFEGSDGKQYLNRY